MFKNLILAILIACVLSFCAVYIAIEWFDVKIQFNQHWVEPFMTVFIITVVVAILVVVGFVVALSVVGALVLGLFAALLGLLVAGVSTFWPVLLAIIIIYYLVKDRSSKQKYNSY